MLIQMSCRQVMADLFVQLVWQLFRLLKKLFVQSRDGMLE